jgi:hypothetical protein
MKKNTVVCHSHSVANSPGYVIAAVGTFRDGLYYPAMVKYLAKPVTDVKEGE